MKHEIMEQIHQAASGKAAVGVVAASATAHSWVDYVTASGEVQAIVVIAGILVSLSILCVNVQSISHRSARRRDEAEIDSLRLKALRIQVNNPPKE